MKCNQGEIKLNSDNITLSICVPVYNHENYIIQALDSILMQKTKYSYEVWIGDDCSTDNTQALLKKNENKYTDNFHFIYREKNLFNTSYTNIRDLRSRCTGKYVIILEGDDYWTDEYKIEKQIDFLESHPEYLAVAHNCVVVDEKSMPKDEKYPECNETEYSFEHYASNIMPGQLATVMTRNIYADTSYDTSIMDIGISPGDRLLYFILLSYGKVYCIQETMSAYRHITCSGSSYSANYKYIFEKEERWHSELLDYAYKIKNKTSVKYAELLYFRCLGSGIKVRQLPVSKFMVYYKKSKYKIRNVFLFIKGKFNRIFLKKKVWY